MLMSGNGSSNSCQAFADFARDWGFVHRTSSPLHPISNDHGEVMVGVAKKILKKAKESKQDPYLLILEYRNSTLPDCSFSPAQLLSRRTRSIVPITNKLKPQAIDPKNFHKSIVNSKSLQNKNYDRTAKTLSPLHVNDQVRIQFGKIWKPARVIQQHDARSFSVQTRDGAIYPRNRRHIIRTQMNTHVLAQPAQPETAT